MNVKVLDCTLRDGGYINDWNFGEKNIKKIISYLTSSEIDMIECGYLSNKGIYDRDRSVFDSMDRLNEFIPKKRKNSKYVCMINYGEYDIDDIPPFNSNVIDGIRVVFHIHQVDGAIEFCRQLAKKGYMLFIQPMVTINYTDSELIKLVKEVNDISPYAFYIVDSFGVMKKKDLLRMFYLIDHNLNHDIKIGYHSHNNLQLAYSNAQSFVEVNTQRTRIIDSSVFGMGRGAGNLNTELFLQFLNDSLGTQYKIYPLLQIIDEILNRVYSMNYWGYSLPHYLSAVNNCHPNYASYLAEKNTLTVKSISEILFNISAEKKFSFDKQYIENLYLSYQKHYFDDSNIIFELNKSFSGKNIIVIAPGRSIEQHQEQIRGLIHHEDTIAISVNFIPEQFNVDYIFISNEKRFDLLAQNETVNSRNMNVILTSNIYNNSAKHIIVNYMDLLNNTSAVKDNSTLMLLKLLNKLNVKKVFLAGLDGYSYDHTQNYVNKDMMLSTSNQVIEHLNIGIASVLEELKNEMDLTFITPTKYLQLKDWQMEGVNNG
ncbi:aldolase catalytic domain-containing protein [Bacillus sp. FJAT-42315]|uniref:aldolase catalytic domain-containing protein n=1 Tax=Bacillus sp. FJAT-42315 TaxID=2014077 RepID=UPI0012FE8BDC|nr:aldolase catalytic domain-containing protein [Bacillus sp. FJAT-42315]